MTNKEYKKLPRGIRNNNPLNIRRNATRWLGEVDAIKCVNDDGEGVCEHYDKVFCQFKEIRYGFRAAFKTLRTYITIHDCITPARIINRWAPSCENDTDKYIGHVCKYALLEPDEVISFTDKAKMVRLVCAMCRVENGNKYDAMLLYFDDVNEGYQMAI